MIVTHELTLDLIKCGVQPPVCVMQNDSDTRQLKLTLLAAGVPWHPGDGIAASVAYYKKPDGTKGWYDTLPDGQAACVIEENLVTATLAPQMLTVSGNVTAAVVFMDADLNRIATFPFCIQVQADPAAGETVSNDYYNYSTMEDINAQFASLEAELFTTSTRLSQLDDSASIVCDAAGEQITLMDASNRALQGLTVYGRTTQNGTPTPESPIALESLGTGGALTVSASGRNLLPYPYASTTKTASGITFTDNGDGSVTVKGTAAAQVFFNIFWTKSGLCLIGSVTTKNAQSTAIYLPHSNITIRDITVQQSTSGSLAYIYVDKGVTVDKTYYPRIELGDTSADTTQWEPYKPVQTLTLSTPNGLPGIPVESGGNYTDADGQQWICDEIDLALGVYVQRIRKDVLDGDETWGVQNDLYFIVNRSDSLEGINPPLLSSVGRVLPSVLDAGGYGYAFAYGHRIRFEDMNPDNNTVDELKAYLAEKPITVLYACAAPIETALSAEELAQYAALHTNKPNTTIYNDASAHMQLRYIADTKTYIDNKFNELAAALVNNT